MCVCVCVFMMYLLVKSDVKKKSFKNNVFSKSSLTVKKQSAETQKKRPLKNCLHYCSYLTFQCVHNLRPRAWNSVFPDTKRVPGITNMCIEFCNVHFSLIVEITAIWNFNKNSFFFFYLDSNRKQLTRY